MKKIISILFILQVLFLQNSLVAYSNDSYQINASCSNEGSILCPGELQPACPGKKKPTCIKLNNILKPSCYLSGDESDVITFQIDDVKCVYGDYRVSK